MLIEGAKTKTRTRSIYSPIDNKKKVQSVSSQHRRCLDSIEIDDYSLDLLWDNLNKEIDQRKNNGENIIIAGNINADVYADSLINWFNENGLYNTYDMHNKKAPKIFKHNKKIKQ